MGVANKSVNVIHSQQVTKAKSKVTGYNHDDVIYNGDYDQNQKGYDRVTIDSGNGNDTIDNYDGDYVSINTGNGNDSINIYDVDDSTIRGGAGNDTVYNSSSYNNLIDLGAGNDSLYISEGDALTVFAGAGNDTIVTGLYGDVYETSINSGTGNDVISLTPYSYDTTINYKSGDGNDSIYGFDSDDVLKISGTWSSVQSNGNTVITVGKGKIYLMGYTKPGEEITVSKPKSKVIGSSSSDSIYNWEGHNRVTMSGAAGNDWLYNSSGYYVSMSGGAGNDTLTGHDSGVDVFRFSGGNDVVTNYSGEDKIQIVDGKVTGYSFNKGDLILNIGNSGTMTLKNMTNHYITVSDSTGTSTKLYSNGTTQQSVIKSIVNSLKNNTSITNYTNALDKAIQSTTTYFTGIQDALDKFKSDFQSSGGGDKFLRDYCGIIIGNKDTGAITGWDAGGRYVKTAESIVPESGSVKTAPKSKSGSIDLNLYSSSDDGTLAAVWYQPKDGTRLADSYQLDINTYYYQLTSTDQNGTSPVGEEYLDRTFDFYGDRYPVGYMFWRYLGKQIADNYSSSSSSKPTIVKKSNQVFFDTDYNSSLWGGMSSNSTLRSAMTSVDDHLKVQDNLNSIDLGLSVDDISRQFSTDTGLILADNSNSSLNMLDTSNITFDVSAKKNLI